MIDLHTHVLPGVDDGCRTLEESLDLVRAAADDGVRALAATPHVRSDFPTEPETMERLVAELRLAVSAARLDVEILPGGELALEWLEVLPPAELRRFGLGGNPDVLLLEFPYVGWPLDLVTRVVDVQAAGITPVLAHPERNGDVQADPERLTELVDRGVLIQVTAASLEGRLGSSSRRAARALLDRGLVHMLASDAHTPDVRAVGLSGAAAAVGDEALGSWLTEGAPRALVEGTRIPERPAPAPRTGARWWPFRRL